MRKNQNEKKILLIVSVVALVAVGVMLMNFLNLPGTFTGQATSALKLSKSTTSLSTSSSCSDSDGGQDYFIGGITVGSTTEQDYCLITTIEGHPPGYLYEAYCSGSTVSHEIISCEQMYGSDYHCTLVNGLGACRSASGTPTTGTPTTTTTPSGGSSTSSGIGGSRLNLG